MKFRITPLKITGISFLALGLYAFNYSLTEHLRKLGGYGALFAMVFLGIALIALFLDFVSIKFLKETKRIWVFQGIFLALIIFACFIDELYNLHVFELF